MSEIQRRYTKLQRQMDQMALDFSSHEIVISLHNSLVEQLTDCDDALTYSKIRRQIDALKLAANKLWSIEV